MAKVIAPKKDNAAARKQLNQIVQCEGFFAAMRYFQFADVNDEKFHELRRAYVAAGEKLYEHFTHNLKMF